jgi:hypothetical protein
MFTMGQWGEEETDYIRTLEGIMDNYKRARKKISAQQQEKKSEKKVQILPNLMGEEHAINQFKSQDDDWRDSRSRALPGISHFIPLGCVDMWKWGAWPSH